MDKKGEIAGLTLGTIVTIIIILLVAGIAIWAIWFGGVQTIKDMFGIIEPFKNNSVVSPPA